MDIRPLAEYSDEELIEIMEKVSAELQRRNNLLGSNDEKQTVEAFLRSLNIKV